MSNRIIFQYPGGEISLFAPKRSYPIHDMIKRAERHANEWLGHEQWQWTSEPDLPIILGSNGTLISIVDGPRGKEISL